MGWATDAVRALTSGAQVTIRPRGGSMRGRIEDGQPVTLGPVDPTVVEAGDVVLVRWKGNFLLHLVKQATRDRLLIGNNLGRVNGWVQREAVVGRVVQVHPLRG
ncbi:hypothetical protein [Archangium violaceum]|uniref:hypothetical protein n=1 Tax=Archangium violaceum TaxID=83451 RepID=UPI0037C0720B